MNCFYGWTFYYWTEKAFGMTLIKAGLRCLCCSCAILMGMAVCAPAGKSAASSPRPQPQPRPMLRVERDGTPAFLRLDSAPDREAFRRWFTAIAEYQALRPAQEIPAEIQDCAALLRYAYRGALHVHTADWLKENNLEALGFLPSVKKYAYPYTALGTGLFRIRPASLNENQAAAFAQFADAKTLQQFNTFFVSRDVRLARPGDLLFYRQLEQNSPYHSMVYVGQSQLLKNASGSESQSSQSQFNDPILVYHTGPIDKSLGEMRRTTLGQLLQHPSPRWRPVTGNSNFLGVYRWNILKEAE